MSTKDFSIKQERQIAEFLQWEVVIGSGATACRPGDVVSDSWLGECKTHMTDTEKVVFRINHWGKILEESQSTFKRPILFVDDGTQRISNTWCMISKDAIDGVGKEVRPQKVYRVSSKTIAFNSNEMYREIASLSSWADNPYFVAQFGTYEIAILHINTFKDCFGEI